MSDEPKPPAPDASDASDQSDEASVLARLTAERDQFQDQFLRTKAEFANYQKRVERDRAASVAAIKRDFLDGFLPGLDALDLAVNHAGSIKGSDPFIEGLKAARDAFEKALSAEGVERIPAKVGSGYDPDLHHVQATVERADLPEDAIVEELRSGYRLGKLVVRHSSVIVAKRPG